MGTTNSNTICTVLILGIEKAGKSLLLKKMLELKKKEKEMSNIEPTLGFNYVNLEFSNQNYNIMDLGGDSVSRSFWPTIYRSISVNIVIYVFNLFDTENYNQAIIEFVKLANEEELKSASLFLLFNVINYENKILLSNNEDVNDINLKVDYILSLIRDTPIYEFDNRTTYFVCNLSKLKEGEFNTMKMLNKCLLVKEKDTGNI